MTKEERVHLEKLKQNAIVVVKEEIAVVKGVRKLKKTFSNGQVFYYALAPKFITCVATGTGCRNGIPFNPNNSGSSNDQEWTWERDSIFEILSEVE